MDSTRNPFEIIPSVRFLRDFLHLPGLHLSLSKIINIRPIFPLLQAGLRKAGKDEGVEYCLRHENR